MQREKITIFALHLDFGGIEKYISYLCNMFENNYDIEIICTYKLKKIPAFEFSDKIKITYLIENKIPNISVKQLLKKLHVIKIIKELKLRKKENKMAYQLNVDAAKRLKSKYVITTREFHNKIINEFAPKEIIKIVTEHNYHNNDKKYINKLVKSVTNFNYMIHCTKELFDYYNPIIKGPKNILIENPIILNSKKSKLTSKNILSVGRLSIEKGYEDLIDVMAILINKDKEIKLTICGDGYLRKKIGNKIKIKGLEKNIEVTGFIKGRELEQKYLNSSLYILPSISEAFGLVLLEAMNYGLPCISFDSASGARELLKNDTGILIKNRDKEKMAEVIVNLINNKEELLKYSKKSFETVKKYDIKNIKKKWYEEVLNKNH